MLALDCESELIAPGRQAPPLVCLSLSSGELFGYRDAEEVLVDLLGLRGGIVGHNIAFDFAVLTAQFPELLPAIFKAYDDDRITDTSIRQKLIDIADGTRERQQYGLADLTKRHFGIELAKGGDTWRLRYGELREVPIASWPVAARQYAIDDAQATLEVWRAQEAHAALLEDQYRQARAAFWLRLMSCWGIHTDGAAVHAYELATKAEYERLKQRLIACGLKRPDRVLKAGKRKGQIVEEARDTKATAARVVAAYGGKPPLTDGGKPCTDDETCRASGDPLLVAYADFAKVSKTLSTDIPMLLEGVRTPIHSHFEELQDTGRAGSSSPNLQNLPRKAGVRECFVPRPGHVLAAADYSMMELHTLAQVCLVHLGRSKLAEALNAGRDPHLEMGARIMGISYEEAEQRLAARDKQVKHMRQTSKAINFGLPGGLGAMRMVEYAHAQYHVDLTEKQARELKAIWLKQWPEMGDYLAGIGAWVEGGESQIEQLFVKRYRGGLGYCDAANTLFQGLAADAAKAAGWLIAKACYLPGSILYGSRPVIFAHDEFILETPVAIAHECAVELARLMVEGASPLLPDVRPKAVPCLMSRWSKAAEPMFEAGRLVPWQPKQNAA